MDSFSLKCFGVGDGMACADRNHSAYLYQLGEAALLMDCGEPLSRSLSASGLPPDTIDRIFISHLHSDHMAGFFMLMQSFWLAERRKELYIHAPADGIAPLRQMLKAAYLFEELFKFQLIWEPLAAQQTVRHQDARVTPFRTSHLDGLRTSFQSKYPGDYAAYSFLIEGGRLRIGHSADLGKVDDLEPLLAQPLDLLVCELAHFAPREVFNYLKGRDIRQIVFTHLGRPYWANFDETRRLAETLLSGARFRFAQDQDVIAIDNR